MRVMKGRRQGSGTYNAGMLSLLAIFSASADESAEQPVADLDALISVSVTPIIQHPLIQVEPRTDSEAFRAELRKRQGQLVYCFEKSLKSNPDLSGQLTVVIDIEAGEVQGVTATRDTFTDETISHCITQKLRGWHYAESLSGEFTLPFTCGASDEAP